MRIYIYIIIHIYSLWCLHSYYIHAAAPTLPAPVKGAVKVSRAVKAAAGEDIYIYILSFIYFI